MIDVFDRIHVDVETFSRVNIKTQGAARYAEDESTKLLVMKYSFNDDPIQTYLPELNFLGDYSDFPKEILYRIKHGYKLTAFNLFFEWSIFFKVLGIKLDLNDCYCTQAAAAYNALPLDLDTCGFALGLGEKDRKDKAAGTRLINLMCVPDKEGNEYNKPDYDHQLGKLSDYCHQDVVAERAIFKRVRLMSTEEYRIWQIDQRMNQRGIKVDRAATEASIQLRNKLVSAENRKVKILTDGELAGTSKTAKVKSYCTEQLGYKLKSYDAPYLEKVLKDSKAPELVKSIIKSRLKTGKTSLTKYNALLKCICSDDHLRGLLQYHAAAPGRWGGRLFQPQNLPRPTFDETYIFIDNLINNAHEMNELLFGDLFTGLQTCIRSMLIPEPGQIFFVSDYSAIEARVLAWLAGEESKLDVFRTHGRIYEHTASLIYKKALEDVTYDERFVGKTGELSLGFGGGAKAYIKMAAKYGIEGLTKKYAEKIKEDWRRVNPKIVSLWKESENKAKAAIRHPGKKFTVREKFTYLMHKGHLYCQLPSGRVITYRDASLERCMMPWGEMGIQIRYYGRDTYTHKWTKLKSYGGHLAHNATQGTARDLMANALINIDASADFTPVLTVHDEIISGGDPSIDIEEYDALMLDLPDWAKDIPVTCQGDKMQRYGK